MRKIKIIRGQREQSFMERLYGVTTLSSSNSVSNLADLISDLDRLVELGYEGYLAEIRHEFSVLEEVVNDTMHMRNLFSVESEQLQILVEEERFAYVRRADLKVEIQFIETNEPYVSKLVDIMRKINRFNDVKNERIYTPKQLKKYEYMMEEK